MRRVPAAEVAQRATHSSAVKLLRSPRVDAEARGDLGEGGQLVPVRALAVVEAAQVERVEVRLVRPRDRPAAVARP